MRRLRPSSVSTGSIEMQLLCTEQSPQPSQTCLVDHDAAVGVRELAALAEAPRLGRAASGRRRARRRPATLAQLLLHAGEVVAVVQRDAGRQHAGRELLGLDGDHRDALHALGRELARDLGAR